MEWSEDQNLALVREGEVLIREPYRFKSKNNGNGESLATNS